MIFTNYVDKLYQILPDNENHVIDQDGNVKELKEVFPHIIKVNHILGYVVTSDGIIHCGVDANTGAVKFDNKKESDFIFNLKNLEK